MSAFKKLKSTDAFVTSYVAKKQWAITGSDLNNYGISVLEAFTSSIAGQSIDKDRVYVPSSSVSIDFNANELRKISYRSINQLYYSNYNSVNGSVIEPRFLTSALSGSSIISDETSSGKYFYNYEESSISEIQNLSLGQSGSRDLGLKAMVYSIPRNLYGTHIEPGSFRLVPRYQPGIIEVEGGYYVGDYAEDGYVTGEINIGTNGYLGGLEAIIDDGEGHLKLKTTNKSYLGNIIYSHGIVIITNPDVAAYYSADPRLDNLGWKSNQPIYTY